VLYHSCWRSFRCLARREGASKFIDHYRERDPQLFDVLADPEEKRDLADAADPATLEALRTDTRLWRARVNAGYEARRQAVLAQLQTPDDSPAQATWGGVLDLLGCTAEKEALLPGESVWAECRWRAREPLKEAWKVRTSLTGGFGEEVRTSSPAEGLLPTWRFTPGMAVRDRVRVPVPPRVAPGEAVLRVGWQGFTGGAIPLDGATDGDDVEVARVQVLPAPAMALDAPGE
jgi:hypothetical protein